MKLILVMVTSLDGRSTRGEESDNHTWTSLEDQKHFQEIVENASLLIMGSTTYEGAKKSMIHKDGRLRVVMTRNPSKYQNEKIDGKLEFSNENPKELIHRLESYGFSEGYLVGGAHTNTPFFKEKLITEIIETIEPKILGLGNGILGEESTDISLTLLEVKKINPNGTLLLRYSVKN